jgi:hypothetical protein
MNRLLVPAIIFAAGMAGASAWSQTPAPAPAPNPNLNIYYTTPLENDPSRIVRLQSVTFPPKDGNNFHRHPADDPGPGAAHAQGRRQFLHPARHDTQESEPHRQDGAHDRAQHRG